MESHTQYIPNAKQQFVPPQSVTDDFASSPSRVLTNKDFYVGTKVHLKRNYVGTYSPTITNVANLAGSTTYTCNYIRLGDFVHVSGKVDVDPTLAATATQLGISLPFASNISAEEECAGTAFCPDIAGMGAAILGDATNDRAQMEWVSSDINSNAMFFVFTYKIS